MALTIKALGSALMSAIAESDSILALCESYYSTPHHVYRNSVGQQSPEQSACPSFLVIPLAKDRSESDETKKRLWEFALAVVLDEGGSDTATDPTSGVVTVEYRAHDRLEELLDLALAAISVVTADLDLEIGRLDFDEQNMHPIYKARVDIVFSYPILINRSEPTL